MLKRKLSLLALFAGIMAFAFNACEDDKNPTFHPSSEEDSDNFLTPPDSSDSDTTDPSQPDTTADLLVQVLSTNNTTMDSVEVELALSKEGPPINFDRTDETYPDECDGNKRAEFRDLRMRTYYLRTYYTRADNGEDYTDTVEVALPTPAIGEGDVGCMNMESEKVE